MKVEKQLLLVILLVMFTLASGAAYGDRRVAVVIGVDQYAQESQIPPLGCAASDAQKLSRVLSQNGYECQLIVDEDATEERITEVFIQIEQQTGQTGELDVFLCYFSGRGTRIPDDIQADETQDGLDECILLSDAVADNPRSYIRDDALAHWVSAVKAKQFILILDCAFWGDESKATIKGIGDLPEAAATVSPPLEKEQPPYSPFEKGAGGISLDGVEIADGFSPDALVLAAGMPGAPVSDGVFTAKFLEACVTEGADIDGDRVISFNEAYQYAMRQLQSQQPPRLIGSKGADTPLAPLPPLSRIEVNSTYFGNLDADPGEAEVLIYADAEQIPLDGPQYIPALIPLKHGTYRVQVQQPGFLVPEAKDVTITEYDTVYPMSFQLWPITVVGQVSTVSKAGESISVEGKTLTLHVKQADKEIHQEALPVDGAFRFRPVTRRGVKTHPWLKVGSEYELHVTGQPVLSVRSARFKYDGYSDINASVTVTLDDIPPALIPNGVTLQAKRLVAGEELRGSVQAKDDDLGLADAIEIQLQPPEKQKPASIPASQILFQTPGTYRFRYEVPKEPSAAGEWSVAAVTLRDKAGNATQLSADQLNAKFLVFASRFDLGKHHFDAGDYTEALGQLKQINPPSDDARYLTALAHYHQKDMAKALEAFQAIDARANYLGRERRKEMPQMPRPMVNKVWGELLRNLNDHRTEAAYIGLLAAAAEELGRTNDAKMYRDYATRLRGNVKRKE